jgi:hypothetical protein
MTESELAEDEDSATSPPLILFGVDGDVVCVDDTCVAAEPTQLLESGS